MNRVVHTDFCMGGRDKGPVGGMARDSQQIRELVVHTEEQVPVYEGGI